MDQYTTKCSLPSTCGMGYLRLLEDLIYIVNFFAADGNNGIKDFMAVLLRNGRVMVMVSLGSDAIKINMTKGPRLDDKEWHTIQIKRDLFDRKVNGKYLHDRILPLSLAVRLFNFMWDSVDSMMTIHTKVYCSNAKHPEEGVPRSLDWMFCD